MSPRKTTLGTTTLAQRLEAMRKLIVKRDGPRSDPALVSLLTQAVIALKEKRRCETLRQERDTLKAGMSLDLQTALALAMKNRDLADEEHAKYADLKARVAERCPATDIFGRCILEVGHRALHRNPLNQEFHWRAELAKEQT